MSGCRCTAARGPEVVLTREAFRNWLSGKPKDLTLHPVPDSPELSYDIAEDGGMRRHQGLHLMPSCGEDFPI